MKNPIITLLTDFGTRDTFVGSMKGVILGLCPRAHLVDLSHEVPPQNTIAGAFLLKSAFIYFPKGTVHLAVVDPGVGSARKAVGIRSQGHFFVGPDNGLFAAALSEWEIDQVVELTEKKFHLPQVSSTFHGRDIFAPVAAYLAKGTALHQLGRKVTHLLPDSIPTPRSTSRGWIGEILWVDHFGNLVTNFQNQKLNRNFRLKIGNKIISKTGQYYTQANEGEILVLEGCSGYLEVSVHQGRADQKLKAAIGDGVSTFFQN